MTAAGDKPADESTRGTDTVDTDEPDEISFAPVNPTVHPDDEMVWRKRAEAYDSQYPGPVHWQKFLNVIAATGSIPLALREVGFSRTKLSKRRERYPEFAEAFQQALEFFNHKVLEQTAVARAVDGVLEPVYHKGIHTGYRRVFSDTLLTKLLEAKMPETYKPKIELAGASLNIKVTGGLPDDPLPAATVEPIPEPAETPPAQ